MRLHLLLATALLGLAAPAGAAARTRYVAGDCRHLVTRPTTLILACGDGSVQLFGLRWSSFGTVARGTGIVAYGTKKVPGVRVTLRSAKPCRNARGRLVFRTATLSFPHGRPKGLSSRHRLGCPI